MSFLTLLELQIRYSFFGTAMEQTIRRDRLTYLHALKRSAISAGLNNYSYSANFSERGGAS
eukprot:5739461-Pyramimonas_sp.AAC.1